MMLSSLNIKPIFNSLDDDIIEEFYNPVLSNALFYERVSAYFDSKILSYYSKGLEKIYRNNGKVKFIFSYQISKSDYELMIEGYSNREKLINDIDNKIVIDVLSEEEKIRFKNLAFLIEISLVDIKIALTPEGIFHDKYGLVSDGNNTVYFRGSNNETIAAITHNYESFETTCSWNSSDLELIKINKAKSDFEELWNNNKSSVLVIDLPDVIKNHIMSFSDGQIHEQISYNINNKVVLDLGNNNTIIYKNLLIDNKVDFRDLEFKTKLKRYIDSLQDKNIIFKNNLNYVEMKKIRECFIDYSSRKNFDLLVTDKLNNYIFANDLDLKARKDLGTDIKNKESYLYPKFIEFSNIVNSEMVRTLRNEQMWNAFHIISMIRSANFSVPGSGKTSIVFGAFAYLNSKVINKVDKIIMIGPLNSFMSWKDEFKSCFGEKKNLNVIDTQSDCYKNKKNLIESLKYNSYNVNLILVNYEKIESIEDVLIDIINERTMLVFDEAHKIKAVGGVRSSCALRICKNAGYKAVLTGTPIPNSYLDIYNMLNILYTEEYNSFFNFQPHELKNANEFKAKYINELIYPFFCRTTKKDLNIPSPDPDNLISIEMNHKEKRMFEIIHELYRNNILTLYIRLLQATVSPQLLLNQIDKNDLYNILCSDEELEDKDYPSDNIDSSCKVTDELKVIINSIDKTSKLEKGISFVESLCREKKQVIVWCIFVKSLEKISQELSKIGISNKIVCGSVPLAEREKIINQFKNNDFQVLITNPHTLAESVSLHKNCHDAVYFEYSFNLTHMLQSKDRINRLGLKDSDYTRYNYLMLCNDDIYNDSIDKKTINRLKEKEDIMLKSIEGTNLVRVNFDNLDDLKKILSVI